MHGQQSEEWRMNEPFGIRYSFPPSLAGRTGTGQASAVNQKGVSWFWKLLRVSLVRDDR